MPDPWSVAQDFIASLNDQAAKNRYYGHASNQSMYGAMIDRQDADWLNQQKIAADENNFNQQLLRDEASREFTHSENWLRQQADAAGAGSKSRFGGGQGGGAAVMPPYQSPLGNTGATTGPDIPLNPNSAYSYYVNNGVHPYMAAGIVANLDAESSFDPAVWSGQRRGDKGTAKYGAQYRNERQTNLEAFARKRGHARPTNKDQLDFYVYEGESGLDAGAKKAFDMAKQSRSPEEAAKWIMTHYERPSSDPRENQIGHRERMARQVFEAGGQGGGNQAQPTTDQRRYPAPLPSTDGTMPSEAPLPEQGGIGDMEHVWTDEELNQYLSSDEIEAIKRRGDVVGPPRIYSDSAMSLLPEEIQRQLMPVFKNEQYGPTEYLFVKPRQAEVTEDGIDPGGEDEAQVTTAPPVEIKTTKEKNPTEPQGSENVKVVDGVWQVLVDGRWIPME